MANENKVLITRPVNREALELLSRICTVRASVSRPLSSQELLAGAIDANGIILFRGDTIDRFFLEQCPKLLIVATTFSGSEGVDVDACTEMGVWVTTAPTVGQDRADRPASRPEDLLPVLEAVANVLEVLSGDKPRGALNDPAVRPQDCSQNLPG